MIIRRLRFLSQLVSEVILAVFQMLSREIFSVNELRSTIFRPIAQPLKSRYNLSMKRAKKKKMSTALIEL